MAMRFVDDAGQGEPKDVTRATPNAIVLSAEPVTEAPGSIERCAEVLLRWMGSIDQLWKERLAVIRDERGWDAKLILGNCIAYVLDHELHMIAPRHPAFDGHGWTSEARPCVQCRAMFLPAYPGQFLCSNDCARQHYAPAIPAAAPAHAMEDALPAPIPLETR